VTTDPLETLRRLCLALPETTERLSHGEPTWFVRGKTTFVVTDAYRCVAPKRLLAQLDASDGQVSPA
jgi:hypothetical protein